MSFFPNFRKLNRDLDDELQAHFRIATAENRRAGMSEREAIAAAHREFGNAELFKADMRDVWGWTWLERLRQDVVFGADREQRSDLAPLPALARDLDREIRR